jgi:tetrahydromethanopterin S-methyltransferase subunit G
MSAIDDIRQVLQDFLAPELRAIATRLDAIDRRFEAVDQRFADLTTVMNARFDSVNTRLDSLSKEIGQVKDLLDFDRRLTRLESKQSQMAQ